MPLAGWHVSSFVIISSAFCRILFSLFIPFHPFVYFSFWILKKKCRSFFFFVCFFLSIDLIWTKEHPSRTLQQMEAFAKKKKIVEYRCFCMWLCSVCQVQWMPTMYRNNLSRWGAPIFLPAKFYFLVKIIRKFLFKCHLKYHTYWGHCNCYI